MTAFTYNHPARIMAWAERMALEAVREGRIEQKDYDVIVKYAEKEVKKGNWRGNISDGLKEMGYGPNKLHDLY